MQELAFVNCSYFNYYFYEQTSAESILLIKNPEEARDVMFNRPPEKAYKVNTSTNRKYKGAMTRWREDMDFNIFKWQEKDVTTERQIFYLLLVRLS